MQYMMGDQSNKRKKELAMCGVRVVLNISVYSLGRASLVPWAGIPRRGLISLQELSLCCDVKTTYYLQSYSGFKEKSPHNQPRTHHKPEVCIRPTWES